MDAKVIFTNKFKEKAAYKELSSREANDTEIITAIAKGLQ